MLYFDSNNKKDCNGCGICALKCPKNAITMVEDKEGFIYPEIDTTKCINCGICKKVCPNRELDQNLDTIAYMAINKNEADKKRSSSGGMFYPIAKNIINKNGVVFGVKYDSDLNVVHDWASTLDEIKMFQGSKYVKSDLKNSFLEVKEFLKKGKYVLFTGTPCQCQALRKFLMTDYEKLITCEIICHANPSPKVFEYYKKNLENKFSSKIKSISFRNKKNGWKSSKTVITFGSGKEVEENSFYNGFVKELFNRPSCHNCHFCSSNRLSDFTIGDLWGVNKILPDVVDDNTGISLFCVNTDKGKKILEEIKKELILTRVDKNLAFSYNHHNNVHSHKNREKFFDEVAKGKINENNIIKYISKYTKIPLYRRLINKIRIKLKKIIK